MGSAQVLAGISMVGEGENLPKNTKAEGQLTAKQRQALPLLAAGKSGNEVASALGVHVATVSKWLNRNQDFQRALADLRRAALRATEEQLQLTAQQALATLQELLLSAESESVRLKAACYVLDTVGVAERAAPAYREATDESDALQKVLSELGVPA